MSTKRAFIAVDISEGVRAKTAKLIRALKQTSSKVGWVDPSAMHVTLKFLGDISDSDVYEVCARLSAVAKDFEPFDLEFGGVGAFPQLDRPRTVWVGIDDADGQLGRLHVQLEDQLSSLGFPVENRTFRPHLTLGRVRSSDPAGIADLAERISAVRDSEVGKVTVDELALMASELTPQGPSYYGLGTVGLGEAGREIK